MTTAAAAATVVAGGSGDATATSLGKFNFQYIVVFEQHDLASGHRVPVPKLYLSESAGSKDLGRVTRWLSKAINRTVTSVHIQQESAEGWRLDTFPVENNPLPFSDGRVVVVCCDKAPLDSGILAKLPLRMKDETRLGAATHWLVGHGDAGEGNARTSMRRFAASARDSMKRLFHMGGAGKAPAAAQLASAAPGDDAEPEVAVDTEFQRHVSELTTLAEEEVPVAEHEDEVATRGVAKQLTTRLNQLAELVDAHSERSDDASKKKSTKEFSVELRALAAAIAEDHALDDEDIQTEIRRSSKASCSARPGPVHFSSSAAEAAEAVHSSTSPPSLFCSCTGRCGPRQNHDRDDEGVTIKMET